jgi:hypothetical protein
VKLKGEKHEILILQILNFQDYNFKAAIYFQKVRVNFSIKKKIINILWVVGDPTLTKNYRMVSPYKVSLG